MKCSCGFVDAFLVAACALCVPTSVSANQKSVSDAVLTALRGGSAQEIIIEFANADIQSELARRTVEKVSRKELVDLRRARMASRKAELLIGAIPGCKVIRDFEHLPSMIVEVENEAALDALLSNDVITRVVGHQEYVLFVSESLPLVNQPQVVAGGFDGAGATVAVLDTGVNYTLEDFGFCTSPAVPSGCRVVATLEAGADDGSLDADINTHGTNVSAIVAAVAPGANLMVADVVDANFGIIPATVLSAINWVLASQSALNVVSINVSFGFAENWNPGVCPLSSFSGTIATAINSGIAVVAAAGNSGHEQGVFMDGISDPSCVPGVISVGNLFDAEHSGIQFPNSDDPLDTFLDCNEVEPSANEIACESQTAPILSIYAPGGRITAGGVMLRGTSQAAPHVAGAWAIVHQALGNPSPSEVMTLLTSTGARIVDARPLAPRSTPMLDLAGLEDVDRDGVLDSVDNCLVIPNASQTDTDQDGYGNRCDADFNQDNEIDFGDFSSLSASFHLAVPPGSPLVDIGQDPPNGFIDFFDVDWLLDHYLESMGTGDQQSGYACAGITVPCP